MKKNRLLENLNQSVGSNIPMKRYSLADMISESYKMIFQCEEGTNLKRLAESHLDDVRRNPRDIERLSRQLSILKEISRMVESNDLNDEDLVDKDSYDAVEPKEDRVIQNECNKVDDSESEDHRRSLRHRPTQEACASKKESIKEADDPDLTDEELEELAKHLETIRKERQDAPKKEMTEDVTTTRRGIKCHITDAKKPEKNLDDPDKTLSEDRDPDHTLQNILNEVISNAIASVFKSYGLDPKDDDLLQKFYYNVDIDNVIYHIAKFIEANSPKGVSESKKDGIAKSGVRESRSYRGLENFKKQSESKAFYKTFKKMHESLKEGKALTRQESIDLYKASNSALTQLSIELEHNPEFLDTFKESVSLLSKDVSSLLESLTRGKAPSKATMKSLAKFSESLLCEDKVYYPNGKEVAEGSVDMDKALDYQYGEDRDKDNSNYSVEEKQKAINYWIEKTDPMYESKEIEIHEDDDDFVGDDEGDMQSEEADAFDQEYADARVELHKDLEDKHANDDDPEVQEKLAQDAEDVTNLPGITDEQIAEINDEGSTEEPTEDTIEDEPTEEEDDSEITDDELEELKKHLKEMRSARGKDHR